MGEDDRGHQQSSDPAAVSTPKARQRAPIDDAVGGVFLKYASVLQRAADAQRRVQERARAADAAKGEVGPEVQPVLHNLVPGTGNTGAAGASAAEILGKLQLSKSGKEACQVGPTGTPLLQAGGSSSSTSGGGGERRRRESSVNSKFRFRERRKPRNQPDNHEDDHPIEQPASVGGYSSGLRLVPGLPVRVCVDAAAVRAWSAYHHLDNEDTTCNGHSFEDSIVRVIDVQGDLVRVMAKSGELAKLPSQVLLPCTTRDVLKNIVWKSGESVPKPTDFAESVGAAAFHADPGCCEDDDGAVAVPLRTGSGSGGPMVWRMRSTPAVGWRGVHAAVMKQEVRPGGSSMDLPPDGAKVQIRLLDAVAVLEDVGGDAANRLVPLRRDGGEDELPPYEETITLGDGEVCDALECAISRMQAGCIWAVSCVDDALARPGPNGKLKLSAPAAASAQEEKETEARTVRTLFLLELCGWTGDDPLRYGREQCGRRLEHATSRVEAGLIAFKAGRTRLALERFRRIANLLSVGLCSTNPEEAFNAASAPRAKELRRRAWLNAAQCELNLGRPDMAKRYCDAVLAEDPDSVKARYRRASALVAIGSDELMAMEDLRKVIDQEPSNQAAKQLLQRAELLQRRREREQTQLLRRACSDLSDRFTAIKEKLEGAREKGDAEAAKEALETLLSSMPELSAGQAGRLRLAVCLQEMVRAPPAHSTAVGELAAQALAEVNLLEKV